MDRLNPIEKALLKLLGVKPGKNAGEGVVRRNTIWEFQKFL
jgi:hypothetical protein